MPSNTLPRLIDFHSHYYDAAWYSTAQGPGNLTQSWPLLTDIQAQLAAMSDAGIDAKVLSAPSSTILRPGEQCPPELMKRINDRFAELVAAYPDRLFALATIDAFHGDLAACEVERAVHDLNMGGICIDCAQGNHYLDAPQARPVLEVAAALGIVVFVHPVSPQGLTGRLAPLGHIGTLIARGTETAASIVAMLRSGIFDQLPNLQVVIPMIGASAFLFAGIADLEHGREEGWQGKPPGEVRKRLYVDIMGFDPMAVRWAVALLGPEHVLFGSDWPIMPMMSRQRVLEILAAADLTTTQQAEITSNNALRLLT